MSVSRKTGEIYYTDEELQAALRNNNALQYALSRGYHLVKDGNEYRLKEHDSMVFKRSGKWYWNSQGLHGGALDFIQGYEDKSYQEAVCILSGTIGRSAPVGPVMNVPLPPPEDKPEFILPEPSRNEKQKLNCKNLFAYLIKERGIDPTLVKGLVERRKIYQGISYDKLKLIGYTKDGNARYNVKEKCKAEFSKLPLVRESVHNGPDGTPYRTENCFTPDTVKELLQTEQVRMFQNLIMVGYDSEGIPRYASIRSMNSFGKPIKVDVSGSDKSYPFVLEGTSGNTTLCVFESPIEAMSYWTLCRITGSKRISCTKISLGGAAAMQALDRYLREHPEIRSIVSGLNNDNKEFGHSINAGQNGTEKIRRTYGRDYSVTQHKPFLDDWNDVLKNYRGNLEGKIREPKRPSHNLQITKAKQMGMAI